MSSVYSINKGVNASITFKGLKAQYIAYLAVGLVLLLLLFVALYIAGVSPYILLPLILGLGSALFFTVFKLSHRYGEHGLQKYLAKKGLPACLKFRSRRVFLNLKTQQR